MPGLEVALIPVTLFRQNCSLLFDPDSSRGAVVDPGGEPIRILEAIKQHSVKVEKILLTHGHLDHAGGAAALKYALETERRAAGDETPVPIIGPDLRDLPLLERIEEQARVFEVTGMRNVTPDQWLVEGDTVTIADIGFEVLHCPGHTPGHLVFVARAMRFAIVGDVLFRGSIGRTDFPYCDHAALISAIHTKLLPLGDDIAFICGHGPGSTFGEERRTNPFLRLGLPGRGAA